MEPGPAPAKQSKVPGIHGRRPFQTRGLVMKWEIPAAVDHRFGFEITMYISTR
jgi:coenzyme PQQ precursor peptide PqqA